MSDRNVNLQLFNSEVSQAFSIYYFGLNTCDFWLYLGIKVGVY